MFLRVKEQYFGFLNNFPDIGCRSLIVWRVWNSSRVCIHSFRKALSLKSPFRYRVCQTTYASLGFKIPCIGRENLRCPYPCGLALREISAAESPWKCSKVQKPKSEILVPVHRENDDFCGRSFCSFRFSENDDFCG